MATETICESFSPDGMIGNLCQSCGWLDRDHAPVDLRWFDAHRHRVNNAKAAATEET